MHTAVFCEKEDKLDLRQFCFAFPSKQTTFLHISEVSFNQKCIKIVDLLIFIMDNLAAFILFLVHRPISEKRGQIEHLSHFSNKSEEKFACETYRLKLEFYNTNRKIKNVNRRIFNSIIMHPNSMNFCHKSKLKSALESFYFSQ